MAMINDYDFSIIKNEAENMVILEMERQLDGSEVCRCEDCILDIATFALNKVDPRYRVSLMGTIYAHAMEDTEYGLEIKTAVKEAIAKIASNPSHED